MLKAYTDYVDSIIQDTQISTVGKKKKKLVDDILLLIWQLF